MCLLPICALLLVLGCSNGSDTINEIPPATEGVASVAVMLDVLDVRPTSDIGDPLVTAAEFTIATVEVVYDDGSRHTVSSTPRTFDVLTATDPIVLGAADVPAGTIVAVDVQVDDARVTRDGEMLVVNVAGGGLLSVTPPAIAQLGCTTVVDATFDPNTSFTFVPGDDPTEPGVCEHEIDFSGFPAGTILRDQLAPLVSIRCENGRAGCAGCHQPAPDECLIFDAAAFTGEDTDLDFPAHGNIVVIAEDLVDSDGDGLVDDPDDEAAGGRQIFTFATPTDISFIDVIDVDLDELFGQIIAVADNGTTTVRALAPIGDHTEQRIDVRAENIVRLEVRLVSSGAVDNIGYTELCPTNGDPEPGHFDFAPMFEITGTELVCQEGLPPDPATIAPPLNPHVITSFGDRNRFLFEHPTPVQTGVDPGAIDDERMVVLRGTVLDTTGDPLPGVTITSLDPRLGQTMSRLDGRYDFVANGGGTVALEFRREGYVPVQRAASTAWNEDVEIDALVMTPLDPNMSQVDFPVATATTARGSTVTDVDGARRATLFFQAGTVATIERADGSSEVASSLSLRLTELTVGEMGPAAMPAELPPTSGYTYAVELSADEALGADIAAVSFDTPVPFYVENFIGFPVGTQVPSAFYDRQRGLWEPVDDGLVVEVVSIAGGLADLDIDGDGVADDPADLGIGDDERAQLAATYAVGTQLWRIPLEHFSPLDLNWPIDLPFPTPSGTPSSNDPADEPCLASGSIIECENQILRERINIPGTPHDLVYSSFDATGYLGAQSVRFPLTGPTVDPSMREVRFEIDVAGRRFTAEFAPAPDIVHEFAWDGMDAYGRRIVGSVPYTATITHVYPQEYLAPPEGTRTFGVPGDPSSSSIFDQCRFRLIGPCFGGERSQTVRGRIGRFASGVDLSGWGISGHHHYDPATGRLSGGDGARQERAGPQLVTIAGGGSDSTPESGELATSWRLESSDFPAVSTPDGSIWMLVVAVRGSGAEELLISIDGAGVATVFEPDAVVAGLTSGPFALYRSLAVGVDGALYYTTSYFDPSTGAALPAVVRFHALGPDEVISGAGTTADIEGTFEGPASELRYTGELGLGDITSLATDGAGNLYVGSSHFDFSSPTSVGAYIRVISPDGNVRRLAGAQGIPPTEDPGPALESGIPLVADMAVDRAGNVFVLEEGTALRRVRVDGILETLTGEEFTDDNLEGRLLSDTRIEASALATDSTGTLYFSLWLGAGTIYRVNAEGIIEHVAGSGELGGPYIEGQVPTLAPLHNISDIVLDASGRLLFSATAFEQEVPRLTRVDLGARGTAGNLVVANRDETEVYEFDAQGLHIRTHEPDTGAILTTFGYDAESRLVTATDAHGNVTTIARDGDGVATAIVGPYGHTSALGHNADGFLASVTDDEAQTVSLETRPDGLLDAFIDGRGGRYEMSWDGLGRLTRNENPASGFAQLDRTNTDDGWLVTKTTAEGRVRTQHFARRLGGEDRTSDLPDGTSITSREDARKLQTIDYPDGRTATIARSESPRFGSSSEFTSAFSIALPSGLTSATSIEKAFTLADPTNPLSLVDLTTTTDVNGRVFTESFDRASLTRTNVTPEGRTSTTVFDANGRVVQTQLPGRLPTAMAYDANGRLIEVSQGSRSWSYTYDARSNLDSVTNPLTETTAFDHDLVGRVTREESALGNVTSFGYDESGNMTSLTPPGRPAHTFAYTPVDLEAQYTPPMLPDVTMPQTTYDYSLDRELELETRPDGRVIDWQYDSAGRLSRLAFPAETRDYSYDPGTGQLIGITSTSDESLAYEYDGDLVTKTTWSGTVNASVEKQYDENFFVVRETVNGAWPVDYVYDDDGLLVQAGDMTITRDPLTGFVTGTQLDNITTQTTYNDFGERETYTAWFLATMLYHEDHERDDLGRITKTTEIVEGVPKVWEYAYDLDGRLAEAYVDGDLRYSYTYDGNGNRTQFEDPIAGVVITADYDDQDRLLRYGDTTYSYTANGELAEQTSPTGTTTFDYDVFANLRALTLADGTSIDYAIDPTDRRIATFESGLLDEAFVYRDDLEPIARIGGAGVDQRYVYATFDHVPDLYDDGAAMFAYVTDIRGSVRLLVDSATGVVEERIDYSPFGVATSTAATQPFGFDGGIRGAGGWLRFGARDYDPTTGRWTTKDALRFVDGSGLFTFATNDPINFIDSTGRDARAIFGGIIVKLATSPPARKVVGEVVKTALGRLSVLVAGVAVSTRPSCSADDGDDGLCFLRNTYPSPSPLDLILDDGRRIPQLAQTCWYHCPQSGELMDLKFLGANDESCPKKGRRRWLLDQASYVR